MSEYLVTILDRAERRTVTRRVHARNRKSASAFGGEHYRRAHSLPASHFLFVTAREVTR